MPRRSGWLRGAWLATTLALAVALVAASWANHRAARGALHTLARGQAETVGSAVRAALREDRREAETAALARVLAAQEEAGLRFVALIDGEGRLSAVAGTPAAPVVVPTVDRRTAAAGIVMQPAAERVRAFLPRPTRGPPSGQGAGPRRFGHLLVEFDPVPGGELLAQATRSLVVGCLAAALLTLAALAFWRQSARVEAADRRLEAQRRLTQLGEMSAVLAHEIRNPLASLKGNAQLLAERLPAEGRERRQADRVVSEATRLEALTGDLLDFARTGPLDRRPTDPVSLLRAAAREAGTGSLRIDDAGAPAAWPLDAPRIRQALVNLLRNAGQVSPPDAPPEARVGVEGGELLVEVRDHGPGVPPTERERIFDPFYTTRTTGTGLGLPVARRVVELHGGRLELVDADGGAAFRLTLPAAG